MTEPLAVYADTLTRHVAGVVHPTVLRFRDGTTRPMHVDRWTADADAVDEDALAAVAGPVLDIGCGPGRHLQALARRGVFGLGVDLSPAAVQLARGGGAQAIVGSIFDEIPRAGRWRGALLLDGNIGIGGRPARLLERVGELLAPAGTLVVELDMPGVATVESLVRLETASGMSTWFPWAEVSASSIGELAARTGLTVTRVWRTGDRWFALLQNPGGAPAGVHRPASAIMRPSTVSDRHRPGSV